MSKILCINPGSTSTKLAVFDGKNAIFTTNITHENDELDKLGSVQGQFNYRLDMIMDKLKEEKIDLSTLDAVVGRGGALKPMEGGIFYINEDMLEDCSTSKYSEHPANLGCQIAKSIADEYGKPCYVVDPPLIDEFEDITRVSGFAPIKRKSAFHALNEKIVSRYIAEKYSKKPEEMNIITIHLGSGISVTMQDHGKCVSNTYGSGGDGPFSPERCGRLPALELLKTVDADKDFDVKKFFSKESGFVSYLGSNNVIEIQDRMNEGDPEAKAAIDGMINMICQEIAASATICNWEVDAIGITGAIARSEYITGKIKKEVEFIADVHVYPGEFEMEGLASGGERALAGTEEIKTYVK